MVYEVAYDLAAGITVAAPIAGYASLGIQFEYDKSGLLVRIRHRMEGQTDTEAVHLSRRQVTLLFEAIEFLYGLPPVVRSCRVQVSEAGDGSTKSVGFATVAASTILVSALRFPAEEVLQGASPRLATLLHLFNSAMPPTSDAEAVRLYYLICEGFDEPSAKGRAAPAEEQLKYTRHFVSHGKKLDDPSAAAFIVSQIGKRLTAYDPTDPDHAAFVKAQRTEALRFIEPKLQALLRIRSAGLGTSLKGRRPSRSRGCRQV